MKKNITQKKTENNFNASFLELTRDENFLSGYNDIMDLLARSDLKKQSLDQEKNIHI